MDSQREHTGLLYDAFDATRLAPVLGDNVRKLRKGAHINKKTFAQMIGVGRPFLNKLERGIVDPRLSVIVKAADALETTPEFLLSRHDPPDSVASRSGIVRCRRL